MRPTSTELVALVKSDPSRLVVADVERLVIEVPAAGWLRPFDLDTLTRERLVQGWDDIGLSLRHEDDIAAYEARRGPDSPVARLAR